MVTYIVDGSSGTVSLTEYRKFGPGKQILVFHAAETWKGSFHNPQQQIHHRQALGALMLSGGSHEVW